MQTVSFAGSTYNIPDTRGDRPWSGLADFVIAAASKALNTGGGAFTLLADINLGASFGLVSTYYKSRTASVASAGQIRLADTDTIKWRNHLNDGDIALSKDTSNNLLYNATKVLLSGAVVNADINAAAAIAYSKLNLATSIVNADVSASAAIAYSKLALTGAILNADLAGSIAYSKLVLTGSIVNGDLTAGTLTNAAINASAAIALTKLAALTSHSRALVSDSSGFITEATTTSTEIGYVNGVTSAIQTQLDTKAKTDLSNVASVSADVPMNSHKLTGLSAGSAAGNSVRFEQLHYTATPVQGTETSGGSTSSATFVDLGATATITPSTNTSQIKITITGTAQMSSGAAQGVIGISRAGSDLFTTSSSPVRFITVSNNVAAPFSITYIDSPATTSSTQYKMRAATSSGTLFLGASVAAGMKTIMILEEVI